jgi:hypothetical protein
VTDWMIFPGHASFITTCAANRAFFKNLPPERKQLVSDVIRELDDDIFDVQTRFQTERLKTILRDRIRQRSLLNITGDLTRFRESLTPEEQRELIDDNEFLNLTPTLTPAERDEFQRASRDVREVFLEIGGPASDEVLERLLSASAP